MKFTAQILGNLTEKQRGTFQKTGKFAGSSECIKMKNGFNKGLQRII